jgi:hypothetical protein
LLKIQFGAIERRRKHPDVHSYGWESNDIAGRPEQVVL